MSCCKPKTTHKKTPCPSCQKPALSVNHQTILHHLKYPENQHIPEDKFAFCSQQQCDIAYFSATTSFAKAQLKVFQESTNPQLCYCFDIATANYQAALQSNPEHAKNIKSFVITQTQKKLCACSIKNPSGRCCLLEFKHLEAQYESTKYHP